MLGERGEDLLRQVLKVLLLRVAAGDEVLGCEDAHTGVVEVIDQELVELIVVADADMAPALELSIGILIEVLDLVHHPLE